MMRIVTLSGTLLALALSAGGAQQITGSVYVDGNGNGKRDATERGVAGVAVSNQDTVVATDASGAFRIPRGPSGILFVSVPDGYRAQGSFWRVVADTPGAISFGLRPTGRVRDFTF